MSAFFSNLFQGRPLVGFRSLYISNDILELQEFENSKPIAVAVKHMGGVGRKSLIKDMRNLYDSTSVCPANIHIMDNTQERLEPSAFVDRLLERDEFHKCYIGGALAQKVIQTFDEAGLSSETRLSTKSKIQVGNLLFKPVPPYLIGGPPLDRLFEKLSEAWKGVQTRKGAIPPECPQCSDSLWLDTDYLCGECGFEVDVGKVPKTITKFYKEIIKYEKESGKTVLKRREEAA